MFKPFAHAEDRRQGLPGGEVQPNLFAIVKDLHGRHRRVARQAPVKTETARGGSGGLPSRRGAAIGGPASASPQAGQACRQEEDSNHASPQAKGAPEAVRMNGMVDDGSARRQTGMYAWML
ncbi:hypothetical protein D3C78_1381100 [compost metagenome]